MRGKGTEAAWRGGSACGESGVNHNACGVDLMILREKGLLIQNELCRLICVLGDDEMIQNVMLMLW